MVMGNYLCNLLFVLNMEVFCILWELDCNWVGHRDSTSLFWKGISGPLTKRKRISAFFCRFLSLNSILLL